MNKIKTWILEQFGAIDAYGRIKEIESKQRERYPHLLEEIKNLQDTVKRHESNLMILHKKVIALELEADILNKRSEK